MKVQKRPLYVENDHSMQVFEPSELKTCTSDLAQTLVVASLRLDVSTSYLPHTNGKQRVPLFTQHHSLCGE